MKKTVLSSKINGVVGSVKSNALGRMVRTRHKFSNAVSVAYRNSCRIEVRNPGILRDILSALI